MDWFLIDLAMAYLRTNAFLCIFELPSITDNQDKEKIISAILKVTTLKTTILFTHENLFDKYASVIYEMKNGKVSEIIKNN